jgi:hypothetical protein
MIAAAVAVAPAATTDPLEAAIDYTDTVADLVTEQEHLAALAAERAAAAEQVNRSVRAPISTSNLPAGLLCVRAHESGGNYQAVNSLGYAGGYQMSPVYGPTWAERAGYSEWSNTPIPEWPPNVQDAVALYLWNTGQAWIWRDFGGYDCDWP